MVAREDPIASCYTYGGIQFGYVDHQAASLRGVLLWGSYLTSRPLATFPLPVLHLSGTLDGGQARPTRIARTFSELAAITADHPETPLLKPVIVLEAVDHAHFFSGNIPPEVAKTDIKSELAADAARDMLADRCAAFITVAQNLTDSRAARQLLTDDYKTTSEYFQPLFQLQTMEADGAAAPWTQDMQQQLLNVLDESVVVDVTSSHVAGLAALGRQHAQCADNASVASIAVFSSVEEAFDPVDASPNAITSTELAAKMISQDMLKSVFPDAELGAARSCKDLNQETMRRVASVAPPAAQERFSRRGLPVTYLEDHTPLLEALWLEERLRLTYAAEGLSVQSVSLVTPVEAGSGPGNHQCKLLAPTRALEYILTDGLRGTEP